MDKMRQSILLTVIAILAILAGGWFLLVKPKSNQAAELRASAEAKRFANVRLQQEITRLTKQAQDLPRQQARLAAFASRIPSNPALPSLIRELTDAADTAGIELVSLAPAAPTGVTAPAAAGATTTAAGTTGAPTEPLFVIPISVSIKGGFVQVQQFVSNLEDLQRTFQVSQFAISPVKPEGAATVATGVTVAMSGRVYMTAATAPAVAPVTAVAPTASPSPVPSPVATVQPTASATPAP